MLVRGLFEHRPLVFRQLDRGRQLLAPRREQLGGLPQATDGPESLSMYIGLESKPGARRFCNSAAKFAVEGVEMRRSVGWIATIGLLGCGGRMGIAELAADGGGLADALPVCASGLSVCAQTTVAKCVDLNRDQTNCGTCGHACSNRESCSDGQCRSLTKQCTLGPATVVAKFSDVAALASGDLNEDGWLDLVVGENALGGVSTLLAEDGGVNFYPKQGSVDQLSRSDIALADMDRDGHLDLVLANYAASSVSVWFGMGDGSTQFRQNYAPQNATMGPPSALAVADFTGDGWNEVATSMDHPDTVSVQSGIGKGRLGSYYPYSMQTSASSVVAGDLDLDGQLDLIVSLPELDAIAVLWSRPSFMFEDNVRIATGEYPVRIASADVNADGWLDVVTANRNASTVSVMLSQRNRSLADRVDYATGTAPTTLQLVDLANDGTLDIVTTNRTDGTVSLLLGYGDGTFAPSQDLPVGDSPSCSNAADFDGDGAPELIVATASSDEVRYFDIECM